MGTGKGTGKSMRTRLSKLPFSNLPFSFSRRRFLFDFRLQIQNRAARRIHAITETGLWEFQQKISHYRYRFSLEFQLISITDTDLGLKPNQFCNHFGYNGNAHPNGITDRENIFKVLWHFIAETDADKDCLGIHFL